MDSAVDVQNAYLDYMEDTECPLLYHRWSFISGLAAMLERNIHFPFGPDMVYPNLYVILLGPPASRKSTAINALGKLVEEAGYRKFAGDRSGKEKFIEDLYLGFENIDENIEAGKNKSFSLMTENDFLELDDDDFVEKKNGKVELRSRQDKNHVSSVFVKASEMQDFIGMHNNDFISWLTNVYDNPPHYKHRLKNGDSQLVYNPTVGILGGATSATFENMFTTKSLDTGILSRFLLVHGAGRRKKIAFPKPPDNEKKEKLALYLNNIYTSMHGEMTFSAKAKKLTEKIYSEWQEIPDIRFAHYGGRRFTILIKMCMINAASCMRNEINEDDVLFANTVLCYTESFMPKALGEFGKDQSGQLVQETYNKICRNPEGISINELREGLTNLTADFNRILDACAQLQALGKVDVLKIKNENGDTVTTVMPIGSDRPTQTKNVDFSLLREYEYERN